MGDIVLEVSSRSPDELSIVGEVGADELDGNNVVARSAEESKENSVLRSGGL